MLKSQLLKSILIILAILIIGGVGYTVWRKNTNTKETKKEEFVCSFKDEFKCEVEELVSKVVQESTVYFHMDFADPLPGQEPWYVAENKLVKLGEKAVPVLIEIIEDNRTTTFPDNKYHAIYVLGRIGGEDAVGVLVLVLKSPTEKFENRCYAAQALGRNKKNPKALEALNIVASNINENSKVKQWAQEALNRKNN